MKAEPALTSGTFFPAVMLQEFFFFFSDVEIASACPSSCLRSASPSPWDCCKGPDVTARGAAPGSEQGRQKTGHFFTTAYEIRWEMITH